MRLPLILFSYNTKIGFVKQMLQCYFYSAFQARIHIARTRNLNDTSGTYIMRRIERLINVLSI